jgi:hypothetical protein
MLTWKMVLAGLTIAGGDSHFFRLDFSVQGK